MRRIRGVVHGSHPAVSAGRMVHPTHHEHRHQRTGQEELSTSPSSIEQPMRHKRLHRWSDSRIACGRTRSPRIPRRSHDAALRRAPLSCFSATLRRTFIRPTLVPYRGSTRRRYGRITSGFNCQRRRLRRCATAGVRRRKAKNMQFECPHCREFDEALRALLVGELDVDELEHAAAHLAYCAPCRTTLSELSLPTPTRGPRRTGFGSPSSRLLRGERRATSTSPTRAAARCAGSWA